MKRKAILLAKGALARIEAVKEETLRVRNGSVWITQHGDRNDYLLKGGEAMALKGEGLAIVTAFEPCLLELCRAEPVPAPAFWKAFGLVGP